MSDLKSSGEATRQPIQTTAHAVEFDPVSEIRKLRQNLSHHIQVVHSHDSHAAIIPNTPTSKANENENNVQENAEKFECEEPTMIAETIDVVNEINSDLLFPMFPISTENETEKKQTSELPAQELVQQIHQTRQLLAQLQITSYENKPSSEQSLSEKVLPDEPFSEQKNNKTKNIAATETDSATEYKINSKTESLATSESFFPSLAMLKMMNAVLMWCGFLGIIFSFQYWEQDNHLGLIIIGAGLILMVVGFLGQFCSVTVHKKNREQIL
jgi:hypothetical protein